MLCTGDAGQKGVWYGSALEPLDRFHASGFGKWPYETTTTAFVCK